MAVDVQRIEKYSSSLSAEIFKQSTGTQKNIVFVDNQSRKMWR